MELFNKFLIISGLELNWNKSMAFWYSSLNFRPSWFGKYMWKWAAEMEISTLLGMAIGLPLNIKNVNSFVTIKIQKKKKFWGIVHLPLAGKQSSSAELYC
jgi:hypothetical protein